MTVNFYKNSSPLNYVTKNISATDNLECELKENCSITEPLIEVLGTNALNSNYMWIPLFSRYYYFVDVTTTQYNTLIIKAHVDVLMSFQSSILGAQGIITRQEKIYNGYLYDRKMRQLSYPRIQTKKFDTAFDTNYTVVLIASGNEITEVS